MTRWNLLSDILSHPEKRDAIGKAWPLFFLLIFNMIKENKYISTYVELKEKLKENPHTIKAWRDHLVKHKVVQVLRGKTTMTFIFLSPYDSLVTCEQNDEAQIKMVGDPATKHLLDKLSAYGNLSLLPVIAEITTKLENIEKRIG
jgi:hypothetical protein